MDSPKIVSFYYDTEGSFYSDKAKELQKKCDELGIESIIVERKYGDRWIDNVRAKPKFIMEMWNKLKEPFIFVDVDCKILNKPDFNFSGEWGFIRRDDEFIVEDYVHYVGNKAFIKKWEAEIAKHGRGSHSALKHIIKDGFFNIPKGYFEIGVSPIKDKGL